MSDVDTMYFKSNSNQANKNTDIEGSVWNMQRRHSIREGPFSKRLSHKDPFSIVSNKKLRIGRKYTEDNRNMTPNIFSRSSMFQK